MVPYLIKSLREGGGGREASASENEAFIDATGREYNE
jgi:hypothetical protein